jgi:osomolarity two-component system, response regulator SKN7
VQQVWEFRHPEFQMNNKDSLDNIRRKAPAPRNKIQPGEEHAACAQQIDLMNSQMVAMQHQQQQLLDRFNELSHHHTLVLQEMISLQKTAVNHEAVMQNVMNFLNTLDSQIRYQRRNSKVEGATFDLAHLGETNIAGNPPDTPTHSHNTIDDHPASPLQHATRLLSDVTAEHLFHNGQDHMNELYKRANGLISTPPPSTNGASSVSGPVHPLGPPRSTPSGVSLTQTKYPTAEMEDMVYPVGHMPPNGIDPTYAEHAQNIPYPMPSADVDSSDPRKVFSQNRKTSHTQDPGWIRSPQILLVEDDTTCRRIGGRFLDAFKCNVDYALDGLEAVNKMNHGSKFDLVLMDIIMPNLDGVSATHLIRNFDTTPIIAMTSNIRSDDISTYFSHGESRSILLLTLC